MDADGDPPPPNPSFSSSAPPSSLILDSAHAAQRALFASTAGCTPFNLPAPMTGSGGLAPCEQEEEMAGLGHGGRGNGHGSTGVARGVRGRGLKGGGRGHGGDGGGLSSQAAQDGNDNRGKGKKQDTGDSVEWNDTNTKIICSLFSKQAKKGNRPNTHLNTVGYDEVSDEFFNLTAIRLSKRQMKNKWDKLKPDLSAWKQLMRKQTGTGRVRGTGVIDMDDEWWKKAKADILGCGKFRKRPLQNEEDMRVMFGDIINDQSDHWNPMSSNPIIPPPEQDAQHKEIFEVPDDGGDGGGDEIDDTQENSPSPTILLANKRIPPPKKQRIGTALVIQEQITKIAESASSFTSRKMGEVTVQQVMDLVLECGAGYDTNEHYIATELFVKKDQREMFMTLPTNEIRFNWLRRKYNDKHGN